MVVGSDVDGSKKKETDPTQPENNENNLTINFDWFSAVPYSGELYSVGIINKEVIRAARLTNVSWLESLAATSPMLFLLAWCWMIAGRVPRPAIPTMAWEISFIKKEEKIALQYLEKGGSTNDENEVVSKVGGYDIQKHGDVIQKIGS